MRANGPGHLSGAPRIADPGSEVDETGAAKWEAVSPGGFSRICPKVALAGMSLDGGGGQPAMAQRLFKSPCEAPPHPRCALIFSDFSVYVLRSFPENRTPVSALLKGGGDRWGDGGACISTPCGRFQGPRIRDKSASQNTGISFCLYKRTSITRVSIRDQDVPK